MGSTNLAYAVVGAKVPVAYLFDFDPPTPTCPGRDHGPQQGKHCSECGRRLEPVQPRRPNPFFEGLAEERFGCSAESLWDMMRDRADATNVPVPVAWWAASHRSSYYTVDPDGYIVIGLEVAKTPFVGHHEYPVTSVSFGNLLEVSRAVEVELVKFGIQEKAQLYVFAYC